MRKIILNLQYFILFVYVYKLFNNNLSITLFFNKCSTNKRKIRRVFEINIESGFICYPFVIKLNCTFFTFHPSTKTHTPSTVLSHAVVVITHRTLSSHSTHEKSFFLIADQPIILPARVIFHSSTRNV